MSTFEVKQLKVGDRVGAVRYGRNYIAEHFFGQVVKINKHGHVHVQPNAWKGHEAPVVFDKRGDERTATKYSSAFRLLACEDLEQRIAKQNEQRERNSKWNAFERKVSELMQGHRNGYGDVSTLSLEEKEALLSMLVSL